MKLVLEAMSLYDLLLRTEQCVSHEGAKGDVGEIQFGYMIRIQALDDCIAVLEKIDNKTEYLQLYSKNIT